MCYITDVGLDQAMSKTRCTPSKAKIITSKADRVSPAAKRITQGKVTFDEMSPLVQESAPYNCHICAPFGPHMAPFTIQALCGPIQACVTPFKQQPLVIEKPAMHQNDQEDELSHMGPRSATFGPIHHSAHVAPFKCHAAPLK